METTAKALVFTIAATCFGGIYAAINEWLFGYAAVGAVIGCTVLILLTMLEIRNEGGEQ